MSNILAAGRGALAFLFLGLFCFAAQAQIVCLGASNVRGLGVSSGEAFPARLEAILHARGLHYSVANAGISGDTTGGMLARLDSDAPAGTRIVVLAVGGNDRRKNVDPGQIKANFGAIHQRLRARGVKIINAMPLIRQALAANMAQSDRIHLTAQGHQWVAEKVAAQIR